MFPRTKLPVNITHTHTHTLLKWGNELFKTHRGEWMPELSTHSRLKFKCEFTEESAAWRGNVAEIRETDGKREEGNGKKRREGKGLQEVVRVLSSSMCRHFCDPVS